MSGAAAIVKLYGRRPTDNIVSFIANDLFTILRNPYGISTLQRVRPFSHFALFKTIIPNTRDNYRLAFINIDLKGVFTF